MSYITRRTDAAKPAIARIAIRIYHEVRRAHTRNSTRTYAQYRRNWEAYDGNT